MKIYIFAFFAAIIGAVVGFAVVTGLTMLAFSQFGMSNREGGRDMTAAMVGVLGGIAGLIIGPWLVFHYMGSGSSSLPDVGRALLMVAVIAGLGVGAIKVLPMFRERYPGGQEPTLRFEIRVPPNISIDTTQLPLMSFTLYAGSTRGGEGTPKLRHEEERTIIVNTFTIYTRTSSRVLSFHLSDRPRMMFIIHLPSRPKPSETFSDWQLVDDVWEWGEGGGEPLKRRPTSEEHYEIRYRVSK